MQIMDVPSPGEIPQVGGSLMLHYPNNTTYTINYDSSTQDCQRINLPLPLKTMKFVRIELAHAKFVLWSRRNGRGMSKPVNSISGYSEYKKIGFSKVKSVTKGKCVRSLTYELDNRNIFNII